jgi:hypothetical protein
VEIELLLKPLVIVLHIVPVVAIHPASLVEPFLSIDVLNL